MKRFFLSLSIVFLVFSVMSDVEAENMYYAKPGGDIWKKVDTEIGNGTLLGIGLCSQGYSMPISRDGEFIYCVNASQFIIKINTNTGAITIWRGVQSRTPYIYYGSDLIEYMYWVDSTDSFKIKRQRLDQSDSIFTFPITTFNNFVVAENETFYFTNGSNSKISKYNTGSGIIQIGNYGTVDIALLNTNTLLVAEAQTPGSPLQKVNSINLNTLSGSETGIRSISFELSIDKLDIIYVSVEDSMKIWKKRIGNSGSGSKIVDVTSIAVAVGYIPVMSTPPGPVYTPATQNIYGLVCETYYMPNMSAVSWYSNFGGLNNRQVFREGNALIQSGSGSSNLDYDVFAVIGASSGSTLPVGSLTFTGTTYADISDLDINGRSPAIYSWLKRGGSIAGWNVVQIRGINTAGFFGRYGIFEGKSTDGITTQNVMYSSGSIATTYLYNGRTGTTWQVFSPVSGFSGVRVGYAPYSEYKSCSKEGFNSCEWRIEGEKNICGPKIQQGFEVGVCQVAGSGSVYGSGSCVPSVNGSGSIIDPGILPGEGIVVNLPDGSTKLVRIPDGYSSSVFTCPRSKDDPWYKYVFSCGAEILANIIDDVGGTQRKIVSDQIATFSNERVYRGSFSGLIDQIRSGPSPLVGSGAILSDDTLILALRDKLNTVGDTGPNIWQRFFTGGFGIALLMMILTIIGFIVRGFRQDLGEERGSRNNPN